MLIKYTLVAYAYLFYRKGKVNIFVVVAKFSMSDPNPDLSNGTILGQSHPVRLSFYRV